ncbi:MAG: GHKL domain-containing protein, partial [Treponema sp.]|nr:GHKL domain-containing protein [Treponema sp.]
GNLLDNALDAVAKVEEKQIKLNIRYDREVLFITVENTFDGVVNYAQDKGEQRIVTRKDGSEHGHGLRNIRRSIDKYNGGMDITHEDGVFSVALMLYVDAEKHQSQAEHCAV